MQPTRPDFTPVQRAVTTLRGLTVALAALAAALSGQPIAERLALLGAGYLAFSGFLCLVAPRLDRAWLAYPAALVDVGAVTAFLSLSPATDLSLWVLYLFPLAGAAAAGPAPAAVTGALSVAGYLATTWLTTGRVPAAALWPVALLAAATFVVATLAARWLAEQQERHAWREVAAARELVRRENVLRQAAAALAGTLGRQVVHEAVVAAARSGLGASVSLVDRASGRALEGDEAAEALVGLTLDKEALAEGIDLPSPPGRRQDAPLITPVGDGLELLAWRANPRLDARDAAWLEELATVARAALARCVRHEQLQAELDRLHAGFEAAPAPLALWDAGGTLVLANAAYQALGPDGAPPSELPSAGRHEEEVTLGDPPRTFVAMMVPVAERRYVLSLYREITLEREALRAKDELISMVGHELRNPLTSIQGYSQMMGRQLGVVQQQVDQLNRLIGDFVDASRLESGQLPLTCEPVDLAELAHGAAERFRGAHEGRALRLELGDVPPVEGDPARLGQVLDNLLSNAAKYSPADSEIAVAVATDDRQVLLSVRDQGAGIAPEHLPHLFDRSYRVPGADTECVGGSGLGLSIARDLVAAHGGRIWAESAGQGQGSTFWVALPASTGARTSPSPAVGVASG